MIIIGSMSHVICCAGSLIFLLGFNRRSLQNRKDRQFFCMLLAAAVMFAANTADSFYNPQPENLVEFILQAITFIGFYFLLFYYTRYLSEIIRPKAYRILDFATGSMCVLSAVLWIISIFNGSVVQISGEYVTPGPLYLLGQMGGFLIILNDIFLLVFYRKVIGIRSAAILATLPLIPLIAAVFEMLFSGPSVRSQFIFLSIMIIYTYYYQETSLELERKESALLKSKVDLMTGRMQPHYLYNVLSTIYYLCEEDPMKAQEAVGIFSDYLRDVLEVLQRQEPVTLAWERKEVRNYVRLEKMRFGDRLQISYLSELNEEEILVPPLSIQPLVENAIRHGMHTTDGSVRIRLEARIISADPDSGTGSEKNSAGKKMLTCASKREVQILVMDDGVGYESDQVSYGEGLLNVQERLRMQCSGTLNVRSIVGEGTVAEIRLPCETDRKRKRTSPVLL